jgi:cell division septation protein DedD
VEEEAVNNQAVYDDIKSSMRKDDKSNKRLFMLLFGAVFVILLVAIIYFVSAPSNTPQKTPTFVAKKETPPQKQTPPPPPVKVDTTVTKDTTKIKETSSEVALLKKENVEPVKKETPKPKAKTTYTGLYRDIPNDVSITDRIYFDGKKYTIQISSWKSKTIAEHEVQRLRRKGFDAFIYKVYLKSKDATYHRVRVGYFDSKKEAALFMKQYKL